MWITILLALAKIILNQLISGGVDLKSQLGDSEAREAEFVLKLQELDKSVLEKSNEIATKQGQLTEVNNQLFDLNNAYELQKKQLDENSNKSKPPIFDHDILRSNF